MDNSPRGINIGTVSGGIVNFGGAVYISPISITKTASGSGAGSTGVRTLTNTGTSANAGLGSNSTTSLGAGNSRNAAALSKPCSMATDRKNVTNLLDFISTFLE